MPARPMRLDEVVEKISDGNVHDVIVPACCFYGCKKDAVVLVVLRHRDGLTELYGACKKDFEKIKAQSPEGLERTSRQGVFLYP